MLERVVALIDAGNRLIFRAVAWCSLGLALLGGLIVVLRDGFSTGSIAMQELLVYLHALVFLGAAAWTLSIDAHVRVDIFYSRWPPGRRAIIDLAGTVLLLLPFAFALIGFSAGYVGDSWARREVSAEAGGLPAVFLLKSLILVFGVQLVGQAAVQSHRCWKQIRA